MLDTFSTMKKVSNKWYLLLLSTWNPNILGGTETDWMWEVVLRFSSKPWSQIRRDWVDDLEQVVKTGNIEMAYESNKS